jgi:hypothetical protein
MSKNRVGKYLVKKDANGKPTGHKLDYEVVRRAVENYYKA